MRLLTAALLAAIAAVPAIAQEHPTAAQLPHVAPGAPIASRITSGTYDVDTGHTQLLFTVTHLGFSQYTGQFTQPTGTLTVDRARPADSRVDITFPIDKVSTTVAALNTHLMSADFFDAARFPTARFVSTGIVVRGTAGTVTGNLTLHGVTRPVTLQARFVGAGPAPMGPPTLNIGFSATGSIRRSDFGLGYGVPLISDRVDLVINAAFSKR